MVMCSGLCGKGAVLGQWIGGAGGGRSFTGRIIVRQGWVHYENGILINTVGTTPYAKAETAPPAGPLPLWREQPYRLFA